MPWLHMNLSPFPVVVAMLLGLAEVYGDHTVAGPGKDDSYVDKRDDYQKNEVAVDYNSGFTGAHTSSQYS